VNEFASLSPIYFATKVDLQDKLKTYRVKSQKNKKDKCDNSPANRGFVQLGDRGTKSNPRADFENQRFDGVILRILLVTDRFKEFCIGCLRKVPLQGPLGSSILHGLAQSE
jgi:hypothetical protein